MGGISILIVSSIIIAFFAFKFSILWLALIPMLGFGMVGFIDDSKKYREKKNDGISPKKKMLLLFFVTALFIILYFLAYNLQLVTFIPFVNTELAISLPLAVILFAFILLGTSNAINITDGLDGLAGGIVALVMCFFALNSIRMADMPSAIFSLVILASTLGFLVFNIKPAKIFMGDTGSLALGGAIAAIGIITYRPIYLALVLLVPVAETLSVMLQVVYFKITHGKRLFKMAPLHHHLEMSNMKETQIVFMFWIITAICCFVAYIV